MGSEVRQDSRLHLFNAVLMGIFTDKDQKSHCLLPSARFSLLVNPSPNPSFRQPEESPRAHSLTPISITNCVDRTQEVSGDRVSAQNFSRLEKTLVQCSHRSRAASLLRGPGSWQLKHFLCTDQILDESFYF